MEKIINYNYNTNNKNFMWNELIKCFEDWEIESNKWRMKWLIKVSNGKEIKICYKIVQNAFVLKWFENMAFPNYKKMEDYVKIYYDAINYFNTINEDPSV